MRLKQLMLLGGEQMMNILYTQKVLVTKAVLAVQKALPVDF